MEKFINILKGLAIFVVVALIGFFIYDAFTRTAGLFNTVASWFDSTPIIIDPYKNATSNVIPYTKEEVEEQITNPDCPNMGDITDKIYIQEYNDVVVFYKETKDQDNKTFYPNLLFLKTEQGLIYNGCTNIHAEANIWFGSENSFTWQPNFYEKPYIRNDINLNSHYANYVIYSSGYSDTFVKYSGLFNGGFHEKYLNRARDYINENIFPHFLSFYNNNVKIWQNNGSELADFNAFYDYIYRSYKAGAMSGTVELKSPDFVFFQIPEEEQSKYPMNDEQNFEFYNLKFFLQYFATTDNRFLINSGWKDDIDANVEVIDTKKIDEEPTTIPTVVLNLSDGYKLDYDGSVADFANTLSEFYEHLKQRAKVLKENPVSFKFLQNDIVIKEIVFDGLEDLYSGIPLNLKQGKYNYTITSEAFIFESTFGILNIKDNANISYKYSYLEDSVIVNIFLKPISSGDAEIIVSNKPVLFTFINKDTKENFSLIFKNTVPGTDKIILPFGSYDYIISSELVNFSPKNGEITVSATNHSFIFEYFVSSSSGFLLNADFGTAEALTVKIPTVETENGVLNCNEISEVWIYHIDSTGNATIKKVSNISNITETEAVILVPYTELSDNFGTTNSTYQIRLFYGQTSYFTTTVQGDTPVKEFNITYDTVMGI